MTRTITFHGGILDGQTHDRPGGIWIEAPEIYVWDGRARIVTHRYDHTGEYLGIRLYEPYSWWTVEPFPRWAKFVKWMRRVRSARIRFSDDRI